MTVALITGVNGQDGSYLAELLLSKSYTVIGTVRGKNPKWPYGFNPDQPNLIIRHLDLGYPDSFRSILVDVASHGEDVECYNLAAQSHVGNSFVLADETFSVTGAGACILMDAYFRAFPEGKFYQASTSEMFGNKNGANWGPLGLGSVFSVASPYAAAKLMAHYYAESHRERGHFAVSGILFNHESERRHESFLTQKVCKHAAAAKIAKDQGKGVSALKLGNLNTYRDWGYAPQYVEMMWHLLQESEPGPMVIGTGKTMLAAQFVQKAYEWVGLDWVRYVEHDEDLVRPLDVNYLCADNWYSNKVFGDQLIDADRLIPIMMNHQLQIQGGR